VFRIVERHGGRLWADGDIDQGASFFMAIPATTEVTQASI
jgi:signal transduction histidine kinase